MKKKINYMLKSTLLIAAITGLFACDNSSTSTIDNAKNSSELGRVGAMENYTKDTTFKATEPLKISMLFSDHPNYPMKDSWQIFDRITKNQNVTLETTLVPMSDYSQKMSLLISAGNAPYIIPKVYPGSETNFVSSGAVLPISDYIEYMPHFQDMIQRWNLQNEIDSLRQQDGKFYLLPGLFEAVTPQYSVAVRFDIFEKNNIPIPDSWDEFQSALAKLKEIYPDNLIFSDRYNGASLLSIVAPTFGTTGGWTTKSGLDFDFKNDNFVYGAATPEYKAMLTYLHGLVQAGVLDKESFTQKDDLAVQKFVTERSFAISANSQDPITYRKSMDPTLGADNYKIGKIVIPSGPAGGNFTGSRLDSGIMISKEALKSENFIAMLQLIDWLYYSPEGQEFIMWGVEGGETFKRVNGQRQLMDNITYNGINPSGTIDLRTEYGYQGGVFASGGSIELRESMMLDEEIQFQKAMRENRKALPVFPPAPLNEEQKERIVLLQTPVKDHSDKNTLMFIIGTRSLDEFDTYVKELESKGMNDYLDLINSAYQGYKKANLASHNQ